MHPDQEFENEKHLKDWLASQVESGKIKAGSATKTAVKITLDDGTEEGKTETVKIT